jgi:plasmid stabilization system protein ParE
VSHNRASPVRFIAAFVTQSREISKRIHSAALLHRRRCALDATTRKSGYAAGVGWRFDDELQAFLQTLAQDPERFRLATALTRKAKMPELWPYAIYFTVNTEHREAKILAVWHGSRNPAALRRRLK